MPITKEQLTTIFSHYGFNDFQIQEQGNNFGIILSFHTPVQYIRPLKQSLNRRGINQSNNMNDICKIQIPKICSLETLRVVFSEYNPRVPFPIFQAQNPQPPL